ncbi:hypothetical protein DFP72DRAFT_577247 [Ephemerocybe angulata]|uniref:Uncharacterized protein n=1 Tax=Ephemerocybe angulata TaxID=980116 RepID=A0A8H6HKY8_9AGAR|nr:hypothetical protein DFP72DRAFT_577247 [Tulosesus angulatus]
MRKKSSSCSAALQRSCACAKGRIYDGALAPPTRKHNTQRAPRRAQVTHDQPKRRWPREDLGLSGVSKRRRCGGIYERGLGVPTKFTHARRPRNPGWHRIRPPNTAAHLSARSATYKTRHTTASREITTGGDRRRWCVDGLVGLGTAAGAVRWVRGGEGWKRDSQRAQRRDQGSPAPIPPGRNARALPGTFAILGAHRRPLERRAEGSQRRQHALAHQRVVSTPRQRRNISWP